jgi:hypothetical protein
MPGELIPIVLFMSIAAVAILRPLTTRLGKRLERGRSERKGSQDPQFTRMMQLMERLVDRMDSLEDRVDFTERMLERQQAQARLTQAPLRKEPERR